MTRTPQCQVYAANLAVKAIRTFPTLFSLISIYITLQQPQSTTCSSSAIHHVFAHIVASTWNQTHFPLPSPPTDPLLDFLGSGQATSSRKYFSDPFLNVPLLCFPIAIISIHWLLHLSLNQFTFHHIVGWMASLLHRGKCWKGINYTDDNQLLTSHLAQGLDIKDSQ